MLYIDNTCTDIYFNLAAEEYLLKHSGKEVFMIWQSDPAVVIGKHQHVYAEVNIGYAQRNRIKIARRQSGGGAVYHDSGNINVSFIETTGNIDWDKYARRLVNALSDLGLQATMNDRRSVFLSGQKVSGSAQCVYKERVLFHATLLFDSDLRKVTESLTADSARFPESNRKATVRSVKSPVGNIRTYLSAPMETKEFRNYIMNFFMRKRPDGKVYPWSKEDIAAINIIRDNKYGTAGWNMDKIPARENI